jgi:hypothetical protein
VLSDLEPLDWFPVLLSCKIRADIWNLCGNESISGIPLLIEKLQELICYVAGGRRRSDSEHQLIPP